MVDLNQLCVRINVENNGYTDLDIWYTISVGTVLFRSYIFVLI